MRARDKAMLERAVQRGVSYLDANPDKEEAFEGWFRRIDVNQLRLSSSKYCIIGQTLGSYSDLINVDDFDQWESSKLDRWAERRGFLVRDRQKRQRNYWEPGMWELVTDTQWRDDAYAYLTVLWRDVVLGRQMAESVATGQDTTS